MTKKELMIKAHEMTKEIKNEYPGVDYKFQLGLCLAYLHKEGEKEMRELKGSEKQVKWAKDIRSYMLENLEYSYEKPILAGREIAKGLGEDFPAATNRKDVENRKVREAAARIYLDRIREIIESESSAVAFIERRHIQIVDMIDILKKGRVY